MIKNKRHCFALMTMLVLTTSSFSQVRLPKLISDGMVLQRNAKVKLWGWASANEKVTVQFINKTYKAVAGKDGKWSLLLAPSKAGGPYEMKISGSNSITIKDVLIGDVWLCSGQSNMEYQLGYDDATYAKEMAEVNFPNIRQFKVPIRPVLDGPKEELDGGAWKTANPKDIRPFSAVAYFFAKRLYQKYGVPIGIINSSVGGTPIEAWTSEDGLKEFSSIISVVQKNKDTAYVNSLRRGGGFPRRDTTQDKGLNGAKRWYDVTYSPKGWKGITVPAFWEDQGVRDLNGVVWYRKEIEVPASMVGKPAKVYLGRIIDSDIIYINGKQVGQTGSLYSERRYNVPADLLKAGKNLVVVRITNNNGKGGFVPDKPYYLFSGSDTVSLVGTWQYKVGEVFVPKPGIGNPGIAVQNAPTALYNGMIAPFTNYTIKGFLWYQGESNITRAKEYAQLQPAQIRDWRKQWNLGDLPFLLVQMPNYGDYTYLPPAESGWATFRESQSKALALPNTGMAVTIDIGEWNDIHPWNKKDVGERLALVAQKVAYGENVVHSGPLYQSATVDGSRIIISFTNTGSGLITNDDEELSEFFIAGANKVFVPAKAKIEGDKIVVWNDTVQNPLYVRYAWADSPPNPNLFNKEGLPASPFRTDNF